MLCQFIPVIFLIYWSRQNKQSCLLDKIIQYWSLGFWLVGGVCVVVEVIVVIIFYWIFAISFTSGYGNCDQKVGCGMAFTLISAFLLIAFPEEFIKYAITGRKTFS
jgi:hypothetical protein